jgi:hypothetical protein
MSDGVQDLISHWSIVGDEGLHNGSFRDPMRSGLAIGASILQEELKKGKTAGLRDLDARPISAAIISALRSVAKA